MSYSGLAKTILQLVGSAENVQALVHCATRLRFTLHDNSKANKTELQNLYGIFSVVESGGQFQVIVGSHVSHVYRDPFHHSLYNDIVVSHVHRYPVHHSLYIETSVSYVHTGIYTNHV
ncbi:MAG: PTS glucose/sucrose transporter subunit IIB, partial [Tolumonas sp.]